MNMNLQRGLIFSLLFVSSFSLNASSLKERLQDLSSEHHFEISGLDKVLDQKAVGASDEILNTLIAKELAGYNYILVPGPGNTIRRLRIFGPKLSLSDLRQTFRIHTFRDESHHLVDVNIMGNRPVRLRLRLLVDTGASSIVLPASLIDRLGYKKDELIPKKLKTANGQTEGLMAVLRQVEVGLAMMTDVEAVFVDDEKLGNNALLGMSFLQFYELTLNDTRNLLILTRKPGQK